MLKKAMQDRALTEAREKLSNLKRKALGSGVINLFNKYRPRFEKFAYDFMSHERAILEQLYTEGVSRQQIAPLIKKLNKSNIPGKGFIFLPKIFEEIWKDELSNLDINKFDKE